jgi:hypothetical protein
MTSSSASARRAILDLLEQRGEGKTICPSEAARVLGGDDGFRDHTRLGHIEERWTAATRASER